MCALASLSNKSGIMGEFLKVLYASKNLTLHQSYKYLDKHTQCTYACTPANVLLVCTMCYAHLHICGALSNRNKAMLMVLLVTLQDKQKYSRNVWPIRSVIFILCTLTCLTVTLGMVCAADNFTCVDGEVKLVGGVSNGTGTVQLCLNGKFGTICGYGFNTDEAQVVCGALGFQREGKVQLYLLPSTSSPSPSTCFLHIPVNLTSHLVMWEGCMERSIPIEFQAMIVFMLGYPNMPKRD